MLFRSWVRDLSLVDRDDHSCGVVDDVEIEEVEPGHFELRALLVGPGAYARRRPRWLLRLLPGRKVVRVAASDVASATTVVRLLKRADELGLATTENKLLQRFGGS